jgi:RNA polymerase sigma-70 factor (ECF subfamily)
MAESPEYKSAQPRAGCHHTVKTGGIDSGMRHNKIKLENFKAHALPHLDNLYRTAWYASGNESSAQDLVQESFIKAYQLWHESWYERQFSSSCRPWLFRIMVSILINKYWPSSGLPAAINSVDEIEGFLVYSPRMNQQSTNHSAQVPFSAISESDIKKAIKNLPDNLRLIVILSLLESFSYREITEIAGINLEAVRSKLSHGLKLMQRDLFGYTVNRTITPDPVRKLKVKDWASNQRLR